MTNEAVSPRERRADVARLTAASRVLEGTGVTCRVRTWPHTTDVAQLVLLHQARLPTLADFDRWCAELAAAGMQRVRTGALAAGGAARAEAAGFTLLQELVLLAHDDPHHPPRVTGSLPDTWHLLVDDRRDAARVDALAFGTAWGLDAPAIADVCLATPRHRARAAGSPMAGYAVTGRDSRQGFLQRLAVHPDQQRCGLGTALVLDSLQWLARWRVRRVLVNTPTDNTGALALYERLGFQRLPERLRVYERVLA